MEFEEWYETFDSAGYTWEGFVKADLEAAFAAGFREASDKAATLPHRVMYDAGYEDGLQSSTPYTEGYAKGYSDGVEQQQSHLRLLAGEVLKAHLIEEWDTMEDRIVERPCQCHVCKIAREYTNGLV